MRVPEFERSVFINCPFDEEYAPILQAIAFCVVYLGFDPRLAPENADSSAARLDRILDLAKGSKYGIHDLSRCRLNGNGEAYVRMNMPFELGLDFACKAFGEAPLTSKAILVLEQTRYDTQKALSDISGWDVEAHNGEHGQAMRAVRGWLIAKAGAPRHGAARIEAQYASFQGWYWERERLQGASDEDIKRYPTIELIRAMIEWRDAGCPEGGVFS